MHASKPLGNPRHNATAQMHRDILRRMLAAGDAPLSAVLCAIQCRTTASVHNKLALMQERGEVRKYSTAGGVVRVEWAVLR